MSKTQSRNQFIAIVFLLFPLLVTACSPAPSKNNAIDPTPYYSAPRDEALDTACRITINLFFSYKKGDDPQAYKRLFTKDAEYRADSITPSLDSRLILDLMPASDEWLRDFPGTPMPGTILPTKPNEYVYYVKFTSINRQQPAVHTTSQSFLPPDFMKITVVADPNSAISCKIANYGTG